MIGTKGSAGAGAMLDGLRTRLGQLWQGAVDTLYPPLCVSCGAPTMSPHGLCPTCWSAMSFVSGLACDQCGVPLPGVAAEGPVRCDRCLADPPPWRRAKAVFLYEGTGRRVILGLKHGDRLDLARPLSQWLARAAGPLLEEAEVVAPVPLHWRRLAGRSFNQAAELARQAPLAKGRLVLPRLLQRTRATPSQDGRSRQERFENQAGAITLSPGGARQIEGRSVLLIDDVLTTGATLGAAAEACLAGGARQVDVLVLARVARPDGGMVRDAHETR